MYLTIPQVGLDSGVHITLSKLRAVVCEVISQYSDPIEIKANTTLVSYNPPMIILLSQSFLALRKRDLQFLEGVT